MLKSYSIKTVNAEGMQPLYAANCMLHSPQLGAFAGWYLTLKKAFCKRNELKQVILVNIGVKMSLVFPPRWRFSSNKLLAG